jgi:hypothetical protein
VFIFPEIPLITEICDECGKREVCEDVTDETGTFPVCPSCREKYFPVKVVRVGLGSRLCKSIA